MSRISKISKLLKLCAETENNDIWSAILAEASNDEVDYSQYPEMKILLDSAAGAAKIKKDAVKVADDVSSFTSEDLAMLRELGKDPSIVKELLSGGATTASLKDLIFVKVASRSFSVEESETILQEISRFARTNKSLYKVAGDDKIFWLRKLCSNPEEFKKTELYDISLKYSTNGLLKSAGIIDSVKGLAGGLFGKVKNFFGLAFKYLPFIGVVWSIYDAYHNWNELTSASDAIKANFATLGDKDSLFQADYIKSLVVANKDNPETLLEVTKLNKLAAFYHENFLSVWYDAAWFVSDLIASIALVASGGTFGAAGGIVAVIGSVAGIGSAIGMIGTEFFNLGMSDFRDNSLGIRSIAEKNMAEPATETPVEEQGPDEKNKEFETRRLFS